MIDLVKKTIKNNKVLIFYLIIFVFVILLSLMLYFEIQSGINNSKQKYKSEAIQYLENKYSETMIVTDEIIIGDEKSVQAYWAENSEIRFFVRKGNEYSDTFLSECLRYEATNIIKDAFAEYEFEIFVSEMKWCNPTPDGNHETFRYLDGLYDTLARVPLWKDVDKYQKIENVKLDISNEILEDQSLINAVQTVIDSGCHVENFQITDKLGKVYNYTF